MNLLNFFLNLLYPRKCLTCNKFGKYFCKNCISKIRFIDINICPVCEKRAVGGMTHPFCKTKYTIDGISSIFVYKNAPREAIKLLKYKKVQDLVPEFTNLAIKTFKEDPNRIFVSINRFIEKEKPCFVPIPLHWWRKRIRWFNQTVVLGKPLAKSINLKIRTDILKRIKLKEAQVKLKSKERQKNVKGIFKINSNSSFIIHNSSFILFDDVWTTGSTIKEAASILKKSGAKKVWGLTLSR